MPKLFDDNRHYQQTDPEILGFLGSKQKQAQMRYHGRAPAFYRLGRKIVYHGADLNSWANMQRVETLK